MSPRPPGTGGETIGAEDRVDEWELHFREKSSRRWRRRRREELIKVFALLALAAVAIAAFIFGLTAFELPGG